MPGYNTLNTYDAYARYPEFAGIMQYGGDVNTDHKYASYCENMETFGGVLQPAAACEVLIPQLASPIETLARLYRRWYVGTGSNVLLVAASNGQLYQMSPNEYTWHRLDLPADWEGDSYECDKWSWVTYEINEVGSEAPVDVLLMSNAKDGMIMIRGDNYAVSRIDTPKKFGVIERYAERIWGGASPNDPDILTYSAPFDPTDWQSNPDIPESGAGDVQQPSWDGDEFTALKAFGSQLIAFKKNRVWRVLNTDPSEYVFKEQYGGGTPYAATVSVLGEQIFMMDDNGVCVYDGLNVQPFQQEYIQDIFERVNKDCLDKCCGIAWRNKYYLSVPLDGSTANNAVIIYNTKENSWLLRTDVKAEAFLRTDRHLYFTSSDTPGKVWQWNENSWRTGHATTSATKWVTPWNDLNYENYQKGGFTLYVLAETKSITNPVPINISVQTEKKTKTKTYNIPVVAEGRVSKEKALHFGGNCRRFRLIIESNNGALWRLPNGIRVVAEIDSD